MIATHVKVSLTLHKLLKFRNAEGEKLQNEVSKITKEIGNATEDSEITFEYTQKLQNDFKDKKKPRVPAADQPERERPLPNANRIQDS